MFHYIADFITYDLFSLALDEQFTVALNFFIYSITKIFVLIFSVIFVISFIRTYFDPAKVRSVMSKSPFFVGNFVASLFGAVTPFCSCSSIPIFVGFLKARVPLGIALSFLITSPLVNEVAFVIMGGLFGWKYAILYAVSGILLGTLWGMIFGALKLEKHLILDKVSGSLKDEVLPKVFYKKLKYAFSEAKSTFKKLYPYVFGGILIGAAIHGYLPQEFFMNYIGKYGFFSVPIAVLLGVPIYAGCSTVAPMIFAITQNGVPLGTSLALMMSIAGLSLPEALILKRVMSTKLLATFFALVAIGIMLIGFLFNAIY